MRVITIEAELHIFDEEVDWAKPMRLAIRFEDGSHLRLRVGGDGETLGVDREPLEPPIDMGEYGRTATFDFTDRLDPALRGTQVGRVLAIHNPAGGLVGLALPRQAGGAFCFWVDGDEFLWGTEADLKHHDWLPGWAPTLDGDLTT